MNSAELRVHPFHSGPAPEPLDCGSPRPPDRRHPDLLDRRAALPPARWPSSTPEKLPQLVRAALADVLSRSSASTLAVPRRLLELVHAELERLLGGLWDAHDVARFIGVHRNWVYLQAEAGSLPCVRIGGLLRFESETIRSIGRGQPVSGGRVIALPVTRKSK